VTRLTNNTYDDYSPTWSPDGQQIVFCSTRQDTNGDGSINYHDAAHLYIMNADGSDQRPLTDDPAIYQEPAWSPNGRWIVFYYYSLAGQEGDYGIRWLDLQMAG
jgi:TolB protein